MENNMYKQHHRFNITPLNPLALPFEAPTMPTPKFNEISRHSLWRISIYETNLGFVFPANHWRAFA